MRWTLTLPAMALATAVAAAEPPPSLAPDGGASEPEPVPAIGEKVQYEHRKPAWTHQYPLRLILRGRDAMAGKYLRKLRKEEPGDPETLFMLGLWHASGGRAEKAAARFANAVDQGLPPGRLVAGPRDLLEPIEDHPAYRELVDQRVPRLIHGPMVGSVTDRRARIWVRTAEASDVRIALGEAASLDDPRRVSARSTAARDFTAVLEVDGLQPDTAYHYAVTVGDGPEHGPYRFRTFPERGKPARFRVAFGGGASYVPERERIWDTIRERDPLACLMLGDNVYIDDPRSVSMQQYCYYRRQSRPAFRRLTRSRAVHAIYDDHDFGTDDCWGGPYVDKPAWKRRNAWNTFRTNWVNPAYGGGVDRPGCWHRFTVGDVTFFMLDCRYYRTDPDGPQPSMLGPAQKAWLKRGLLESEATFKVLVSSVPWDFRTKGDAQDTWHGYRAERGELFGFLADNEIEGVVLMSADRHRSDAWRIRRDNAYDLYELNSSRLTNVHRHGTKDAALFSYNETNSFGLVTFDTEADDPTVTYKVVTIDGKSPHSLTVHRSDLRH